VAEEGAALRESDLVLAGGSRTLRVWDSHPGDAQRLAVHWHHGSPGVGLPPTPLLDLADELGLRWVAHTRPGYPGSTPRPRRRVADEAADVEAVLDVLGLDAVVPFGHSGGGAHALAVAAGLPALVPAAVSISGLAPHSELGVRGFDWYAGFGPAGMAEMQAAARGRSHLESHLATATDEPDFTPEDSAALEGRWSWFLDAVRPAFAEGAGLPGGFLDDDLAHTSPWGFDPAAIACPVLVVHGGRDAVVPPGHADWLARTLPRATRWERPDDGHITVIDAAADALRWVARLR